MLTILQLINMYTRTSTGDSSYARRRNLRSQEKKMSVPSVFASVGAALFRASLSCCFVSEDKATALLILAYCGMNTRSASAVDVQGR